MARIEKTSRAESDAIGIWLYISQDDPIAVSRMLHDAREPRDLL